MKTAFLSNIISPYRLPVFQKLSELLNHDFCVMINAQNEFDRNWDLSYQDLQVIQTPTWSIKRKVHSRDPIPFTQVITLHIPYGLWNSLRKYKPDTVISLELGVRTLIAWLYCSLFRKKLIIWAYQSRISATQGKRRLWLRKFLLARADAVIGMGIQAREVLRSWGTEENKIFDALNAADTTYINQCIESSTSNALITKIRDSFPDKKIAIAVGRLIPLKGLENLIAAWKDLDAESKKAWTLVIIGDGVLKPYLDSQCDDTIHLVGHVSSQDMPYWYLAADLHIFPTLGDVWGLVVNEASQCKTPTLCSPLAGCFDELIQEGKTGFTFDLTTPQNTTSSLQKTLQYKNLSEIGNQAAQQIQKFTTENMARSFLRSIQYVN